MLLDASLTRARNNQSSEIAGVRVRHAGSDISLLCMCVPTSARAQNYHIVSLSVNHTHELLLRLITTDTRVLHACNPSVFISNDVSLHAATVHILPLKPTGVQANRRPCAVAEESQDGFLLISEESLLGDCNPSPEI